MRWLFLLAVAAAQVCFGQQVCPWLNAATASGVLESEASASTTKETCEFKAKTGQLQIRVKSTPDAEREIAAYAKRCKRGVEPLKAIGNEAFACFHGDREVVVGLVRQQIFTITIAMKGVQKESLLDKAHLVAEQVSGALF